MTRELDEALGLNEILGVEASAISIALDTRRYGKTVTTIGGFDTSVDIDATATELKKHVGAGGTVKDGRIELQGDHRVKVKTYLEAKGYRMA